MSLLLPISRMLLVAMLVFAHPLTAQHHDHASDQGSLEQRALAAYTAEDYELARDLLQQQMKAQPTSSVPHYNMACVLAATGEVDESVASLLKAVELGFADRLQLEHDPHLAPIRDHKDFVVLLARWGEVLNARADATQARHEQSFGRSYTYSRDEEHRLLFVSSYTPQSFDDARLEINAVAQWGQAAVFRHSPASEPTDNDPDPWVSVVLPTPQRFRAWAVEHFGAGALQGLSQVGGLYDHDAKELWAADLGGTLRHEFFHVMHWRSMTRLGQRHPMWIQEGLASLVETMDLQEGQTLQPVPCIRTNIVRRHASTNLLIPIRDLVSKRGALVQRDQPLRFYAQARAVFLYLHERNRLDRFYAHYTRHYREDPSGLTSLLVAMDQEATEFDSGLRAWAIGLPQIPEDVRSGDAALGVRIDVAQTGEGLEITGFPGRRPAGLRLGDIITHVAGRPTRDYFELVRVVTSHTPGETVEVRYRRRTTHGQTTITLQRAP